MGIARVSRTVWPSWESRMRTFLMWSCCRGCLALVSVEGVSRRPWNDADISAFMTGIHSGWVARGGSGKWLKDQQGSAYSQGHELTLCAPKSPSFFLTGHEESPEPEQSVTCGGSR